MSHGVVTFERKSGKFDIDVTTFQMAILFSWNSRPYDRLSLESLQMATGLALGDLKRNLWVKFSRKIYNDFLIILSNNLLLKFFIS